MGSLQAYSEIRQAILDTNKKILEEQIVTNSDPSYLVLDGVENTTPQKMEIFTDEYIKQQLKNNEDSSFLIFTNLATMPVKGKSFSYILYKCYHKMLEQGLVYYQPIDKETLEPSGDLQFSNQEENIFFKVDAPKFEESTCNAIEAKDSTPENKKIVFLLGNMNEDRILFDIERLIINTIHNCLKHTQLNFEFIISMARYGGDFTPYFETQLNTLKKDAYTVLDQFSNISFEFQYAE